MKISELIKSLDKVMLDNGDIEVVMQGTLLKDGFSAGNSKLIPDVFESTVETLEVRNSGKMGKRVRLYWQC